MSDNTQPSAPHPPGAGGDGGGGDSLDPKIGALLAYLLFGWIGGLIMYLTQKHPVVRFHGAQSILLSIAAIIVYAVLGVVTGIVGRGLAGLAIVGLLNLVLGLGLLALWIFLCIKAYNLEKFKLPIIGDIAEKWAAR